VTSYAAISDDGTVRLERAFPIPVDQLWAYLTAGRAAPDFAAGWHRHLDTLGYLACGTQPPTGRPAWQDLHQHYLAPADG
jgi:hypothetical protein